MIDITLTIISTAHAIRDSIDRQANDQSTASDMRGKAVKLADLKPSEAYELACELAKVNLFGPWKKFTAAGVDRELWYRDDPLKLSNHDRVSVFHWTPTEYSDTGWCSKEGWYWELGFGVVCVSRVSNCKGEPCATKEAAMQAADAVLREAGCILVG